MQARCRREAGAAAATAEYVALEGKPLAWIATGAIYWVHGDHLGTPQMLTDAAAAVAWDATYRPFGEATVTGALTFNLRFPGQYEDAETGMHYNYFRDYDAGLGRYIQSDPIGLGGGWNTYAYVDGRPNVITDPKGLRPKQGCCQAALRMRLMDGRTSGGTVICCDGKKVACVYIGSGAGWNQKAWAIIRDCKTAHEYSHFPEVDCPSCGISRPNIRDKSKPESECPKGQVEIKCAMNSIPKCGGDPKCEEDLRHFARGVANQNNNKYSCWAR